MDHIAIAEALILRYDRGDLDFLSSGYLL